MLAFVDTEVSVDSKKVQDYGAIRDDGAVLHTRTAAEFHGFISRCNAICGHNIIIMT